MGLFLFFVLSTGLFVLDVLTVRHEGKKKKPQPLPKRTGEQGDFQFEQLVEAKGHCPVCSHDFTSKRTVNCATCETPHHHECWNYNNRQCAMFGCMGKVWKAQPSRSN